MLKPTLVSIVALDGRNEDELLALATGAADGHNVVVGDAQRFAELGRRPGCQCGETCSCGAGCTCGTV
jgi:hypothetical protein